MGWCGTYYGGIAPSGKERMDAALRSENLDQETEHGKVIASSIVGTTVYAAYQIKATNEVFALVLLTRFDDGYLMIKSLDETAGPYECKCPLKILRMLSPTTNEYASTWREQCYKWNERQCKSVSVLPLGTTIQLMNPQKTILRVEKDYNGRRCYRGIGVRASAKCVNGWGYEVIKGEIK